MVVNHRVILYGDNVLRYIKRYNKICTNKGVYILERIKTGEKGGDREMGKCNMVGEGVKSMGQAAP